MEHRRRRKILFLKHCDNNIKLQDYISLHFTIHMPKLKQLLSMGWSILSMSWIFLRLGPIGNGLDLPTYSFMWDKCGGFETISMHISKKKISILLTLDTWPVQSTWCVFKCKNEDVVHTHQFTHVFRNVRVVHTHQFAHVFRNVLHIVTSRSYRFSPLSKFFISNAIFRFFWSPWNFYMRKIH
jgi:hypothetical protein